MGAIRGMRHKNPTGRANAFLGKFKGTGEAGALDQL
jgi:hypothetical protein